MAGDWIKFEHATPDKPEVVKLADILGIDQDAVVGKLVRLWIWADAQSVNGHGLSVTNAFIDRLVYCNGFAVGLVKVGWLEGRDGRLSIPNFDRHNGQSAKTRALASDRKRKQRKGDVTDESRNECDNDVTREEKRREEVVNNVGGKFHGGYGGGGEGSRPVRNYSDRDFVLFVKRMVELVPGWGATKLNRFEYEAAESAYLGAKLGLIDFDLLADYLNSTTKEDKHRVPFRRPMKREKLFENLADWLAHAARWDKETGRKRRIKNEELRMKKSDAQIVDGEEVPADDLITDEDLARWREEMGMPPRKG